jgi:hypothetical protein
LPRVQLISCPPCSVHVVGLNILRFTFHVGLEVEEVDECRLTQSIGSSIPLFFAYKYTECLMGYRLCLTSSIAPWNVDVSRNVSMSNCRIGIISEAQP